MPLFCEAGGVGGMAMFDFDFLSDTNITNNNSIALSAAPANTPSTKSSTNLFDGRIYLLSIVSLYCSIGIRKYFSWLTVFLQYNF